MPRSSHPPAHPAPARAPERRDAARNRALLLAAAREVLAEQGADAPLENIARAAGVSRTTLHRHFPDRIALLATVLEDDVRRIEERAAALGEEPGGLIVLFHEVLAMQASAPWVPQILGDAEALGMLALSRRVEDALAPLADRARAAGLTHPEVGVAHLVRALPMAMGIGVRADPAEAEAQSETVRQILHRGLFTTSPER